MIYLAFLICFFVLFTLLAWRDFSLALRLLVFLLPAYLIRFHIGPLPSTALEGMLLILFLIWGIKLLRERRAAEALLQVRTSLFFWPGLLLVAAAGLSVIWAVDTRAALGIFKAYVLEPFIFYALLITTRQDEDEWKQLLLWMGGTVIALTVMAIVQRITGWWSPEWEWTVPGQRRVTGLFTSPNALGLYVVPIAMSFFAWFLSEQDRRARAYRLAVLLSAPLAVLLAVSRGALAAMTATAWLLVARFRSFKLAFILLAIAAASVLAMPSTRSTIIDLATFQVASGQSRLELYKGTVHLLMQEPFTGLGLASFADRFETVRSEVFSERLIYPHSFFLNFWSETGLLGLIAVIWMIVLILRSFWRNEITAFSWIFAAGLLPILLHGLIDVSYFKNDLAVLTWFLLAGFAASVQIAAEY